MLRKVGMKQGLRIMEQQCYCSNSAALRTALNLKNQLSHNVTFDWKELVQGLA